MTAKFQDYYSSLGVSRTASAEEIQRAYRALARQYHPDVNKEPGAEARFKEINEAYEVLKDPKKRERYDALGANWRAGDEFRPPPGWQPRGGARRAASADAQDFGGFSEFFESVFGGSGGFDVDDFIRGAGGSGGRGDGARYGDGQTRPRRGADHEAEVTISLTEAVRGGTRQIALRSDDDADGQTRTYEVRIPPGVTNGSTIRLPGQGGGGRNGGEAGDLLLRVNIAPDPRFRIEPKGGHDLVTVINISPAEAALGTKIDVPTVDGEVRLTIPPGSQSGQRMRIRGHGLTKRSGDRGDLFAELRIVVPRELSPEERAAYEQLARVTRPHERHG